MSRALELAALHLRDGCDHNGIWNNVSNAELESLYTAIRTEALREAAQACKGEYVEATGEEGDSAYNTACDHCAAAILALTEKGK